MAQLDRSGHQLRRLTDGKPEHQALIAGSLFVGFFSLSSFGVDALGNIARLPAQGLNNDASVGLELGLFVDVSNFANSRTDLIKLIEECVGGDFAGDDNQTPFGESFAGHPAMRVPSQTGIKDSIGNGITDLIRMTFGHGFRGKDVASHHSKRGSRSAWLGSASGWRQGIQ